MAISKIKPLKKTLKKALEYITNPEKTENGRYVSSFGCTPETADIEMQLTTEKARNKSERIAYHMIQSFSPEDVITPEKALEIGRKFAESITEGKYEFVVTTHIDKGHIHNHIIFNSTSFVDYRKFHMPVWHKYKMFNINDRLCRDNGLSVIDLISDKKGKSWYEDKMSKENKSWKDKMQDAIDSAIIESTSYKHFVEIMQMEGYEYAETERTLKFRASNDGQIKFTRIDARNFGEYYTKEMLIKRIEDKQFDRNIDKRKKTKETPVSKKTEKSKVDSTSKKPFFNSKKINLIVDISKNIKAQNSKGYEHALVMSNINAMVKTMNFLQTNGLTTIDELAESINNVYGVVSSLEENLKHDETARKALSEKIKFSQNYVKYKKIALQAKREPLGSTFLNLNRNEIMLFNMAEIYMEKNNIDTSFLDIRKMIQEHKEKLENVKIMRSKIAEINKKYKELEDVKTNVEMILDIKIETEKDKRQINQSNKRKEKYSTIEH